MTQPYYRGEGIRCEQAVDLPLPRRELLTRPEHYLADEGLRDACNVALMLGQPLLLTGEPGTGKTQFAASLAWEMRLGEPLKFETRSTSTARDLFYTYDALKRFQDIQSGSGDDVRAYVRYEALGLAMLRTRKPGEIAALLPPDAEPHAEPCRSVVLIDEVDKAPRDFPNDILNELEHMYFRVPELHTVRIVADPALQPIVVMTSNSEKDLPDAFLRRCIYYHIPFPDRTGLTRIIESHLGRYAGGSSAFLEYALDIFTRLRQSNMDKKPATAELLGWLVALRKRRTDADNPLAAQPDLALQTLGALVKTEADQKRATSIVQAWIDQRQTAA